MHSPVLRTCARLARPFVPPRRAWRPGSPTRPAPSGSRGTWSSPPSAARPKAARWDFWEAPPASASPGPRIVTRRQQHGEAEPKECLKPPVGQHERKMHVDGCLPVSASTRTPRPAARSAAGRGVRTNNQGAEADLFQARMSMYIVVPPGSPKLSSWKRP